MMAVRTRGSRRLARSWSIAAATPVAVVVVSPIGLFPDGQQETPSTDAAVRIAAAKRHLECLTHRQDLTGGPSSPLQSRDPRGAVGRLLPWHANDPVVAEKARGR